MTHRDILAIGTSAGGFEALRFLARELPADFPAAVLVVIHLSAEFQSGLDRILSRSGPLPARFAKDGESVCGGHLFIAPPKSHLLLDGDCLRLGNGPHENNARPAIDPLFRSVAVCCGSRAVGVVLTGTLGDGASGLEALRQCGGMTVVQDPKDAAYPEMPQTALRALTPNHVVGLHEMPALLARLAREPAGVSLPVPPSIVLETEIARNGRSTMSILDRLGHRSVLTCPDCNGVMWEINEGHVTRYRCHVGHAYTADLMSLALDESLRRAPRARSTSAWRSPASFISSRTSRGTSCSPRRGRARFARPRRNRGSCAIRCGTPTTSRLATPRPPASTSPPPRRGSGRVDPACAHSTEQVREPG